MEELGVHLGRVASERFELEARCERMDREMRALQEELGRWKSDTVQSYVAAFRARSATAADARSPRRQQPQQQSGGVLSILRGAFPGSGPAAGTGGVVKQSVAEDFAATTQAVLEDTLLRNIQLQGDVKLLGEECDSLLQHSKALEAMVRAAGGTPPPREKDSK